MKIGIYSLLISSILYSCGNNTIEQNKDKQSYRNSKIYSNANTSDFNHYWYNGTAEISTYSLSQVRYGENHDGNATLVYVTEDFLADQHVKAEAKHDDNIPVLKLNVLKQFMTGVYPYFIMNSSFHPLNHDNTILKNSLSIQEWCGNTFIQINTRDHIEFQLNSYFEDFNDYKFNLEKENLENQIWTSIRINPDNLPTGSIDIIPSMEFLALEKKEIKAYSAQATLQMEDSLFVYELNYPELKRGLKIRFSPVFPYLIEYWEESSILSNQNSTLTTIATRVSTVQNDYWNYNRVADSSKLTEARNIKQITKPKTN